MSSAMPRTNRIASDPRRFRARALATMFGSGALLGLIAVLVPHGAGVNGAAWAVNSSLGLPVCVALLLLGGRTPAWLVHGLLATAAAMVSLGLVFGGGGQTSVATSFFFVWIALYVSWFFSVRVTLVHVVGDSMVFGVMLAVVHVPAGPAVWLLVMGTAGVVSAVVTLMHRELVRVANRDPLTGLPTRHVLGEAFAREIARAQRTAAPLCLAILDVDGLKCANDRYGHAAGDRLLTDAADAWRSALRDTDLLFRFGGDEFVAILPDCSQDGATEATGRLRGATTARFSIGVAWWGAGDDLAAVLERADTELYKAKRLVYAQPEPRAAISAQEDEGIAAKVR